MRGFGPEDRRLLGSDLAQESSRMQQACTPSGCAAGSSGSADGHYGPAVSRTGICTSHQPNQTQPRSNETRAQVAVTLCTIGSGRGGHWEWAVLAEQHDVKHDACRPDVRLLPVVVLLIGDYLRSCDATRPHGRLCWSGRQVGFSWFHVPADASCNSLQDPIDRVRWSSVVVTECEAAGGAPV